MISIIVGTNRTGSHSANVARNYQDITHQKGIPSQVFSLEHLPDDFFTKGIYGTPSTSFEQVLNTVIVQPVRFLFIIPEYNGSYPGILKFFMDIIHPSVWAGKRVALTGVATGRAGNVRGLDHFTAVLHYLKADVYYLKPYLSAIHQHIDANKNIVNAEYRSLMEQQIEGLMRF